MRRYIVAVDQTSSNHCVATDNLRIFKFWIKASLTHPLDNMKSDNCIMQKCTAIGSSCMSSRH